MGKQVVIEWQSPGVHIIDGLSYERDEGDQDVVDRLDVRGLLQCGKVKVVGTPEDIKAIGEPADDS